MSLRDALAERLKGKVVVVGVGNLLRGDDAAGSLVAQRLIADGVGAHVIDAQEVPESYLGEITRAGPDAVVLVDAVDMGAAPGSVALLEKDDVGLYFPTTHRMPLALMMEFLQRETGADVFVLAVQPASGRVGFAAPMSEEVTASVGLVADILAEVLLLGVGARHPASVPMIGTTAEGAAVPLPSEKGTVQCRH
jgi:hydrogenase 3 maturation protease